MGKKMPVIKGKELLSFFIRIGFELKRVKGSHYVVKSNVNNKMFVIPIHSNEELDRGTLKNIIQQSGLGYDKFLLQWNKK